MFTPQRSYRRRELHDQYGGQRQGGISTPQRYQVIFSGSSGPTYGYEDRWTDKGAFEYYGEDQRGNMQLSSGNAALLKHAGDGKDVPLFEALGGGLVR